MVLLYFASAKRYDKPTLLIQQLRFFQISLDLPYSFGAIPACNYIISQKCAEIVIKQLHLLPPACVPLSTHRWGRQIINLTLH